MASSKRSAVDDDGEGHAPRQDAPTRKVEVLSADFAESLLETSEYAYADSDDERVTTRELPEDPSDPDGSGAHADRAALEAARLIVVDAAPRAFQSSPPPPAAVPPSSSVGGVAPPAPESMDELPMTSRRPRAIVIASVVVVVVGLLAILASASTR